MNLSLYTYMCVYVYSKVKHIYSFEASRNINKWRHKNTHNFWESVFIYLNNIPE